MPPQIVDHFSQHWTERDGQAIVAIVMHGTGGTNSLAYLTKNNRRVSIHYLIPKDGKTIYRMVDESRGANHAGAPSSSLTLHGHTYTGGQVNRVTIGVELENLQDGRDLYPDVQLFAMGWLIGDLRARWGALPVVRHQEIDPTRKRDPYQLSVQDMERWVLKALPPVSLPGLPRIMHVKGLPIYQRQDRTGPLAGHLTPAETVTIDATYGDGGAHLADGRGFVDIQGLEAV